MKLRIIAAAAATIMLAMPSLAETEVTARAGDWEAFSGTTVPKPGSGKKAQRVCGVSQSMADDRYVSIKFFEGDTTFTLQIGWKQWRINDGDKQEVAVTMDNNPAWTTKEATGMHFNDGDAGLELTVKSNQLNDFMQEFRNSGSMRFRFPGSGARDWNVSLTGSGAVTDAFDRCRRALM